MAGSPVRERSQVYQFRVVLLEVAPPIWRSIQVPETYSFWDLHVALQDSMGWLDYHLHLLRVSKPVTGKVVQIGIPDDDPFAGDEPILPGWEVPIASYFSHPGGVAQYDYDFGDGGNTSSLLRRSCRANRGRSIHCASAAPGRARPRTVVASEAMKTS